MNQKIKSILKSVFVAGLFLISLSAFAAWVAPVSAPTGNNATPPINTSGTAQTKSGTLTVNGLAVQSASALGLTDFTSNQTPTPVVSITNTNSTSNAATKALSVTGANLLATGGDSGQESIAGYFKGGNLSGSNQLHTYGIKVDTGTGGVNALAAYINGKLRVVDGTQGVGKVLTSDANGVASWAAAGGASQSPWTTAINAAGYTLNGDSIASGKLTLDSTSNATKGLILLNPTGGKVGIGTSTTAANTTNLFTINQTAVTPATVATYGLAVNVANSQYLTLGADTNYGYIQSWNAKPLYINSQGNNIILGKATGSNVGIGTTIAPSAKLDVQGNTVINGNLLVSNSVPVTSTGWWFNYSTASIENNHKFALINKAEAVGGPGKLDCDNSDYYRECSTPFFTGDYASGGSPSLGDDGSDKWSSCDTPNYSNWNPSTNLCHWNLPPGEEPANGIYDIVPNYHTDYYTYETRQTTVTANTKSITSGSLNTGNVDLTSVSFTKSKLLTATLTSLNLAANSNWGCYSFNVTGIPVSWVVDGGGGYNEFTRFIVRSSLDTSQFVGESPNIVSDTGGHVFGLKPIQVCGVGVDDKNFLDSITVTYLPLTAF